MSINRQILALAWPAIATNITTPLLSLADVAITGHLEGGHLIGAVAVGGTVFNVLYWIFAFLRMGTSGITAQAYGASDRQMQHHTLVRGCLVATCGAMLLLILSPFCGRSLIDLVDGGSSVQNDAWRYFQVAICGAPGVLLTFVISGWLLGMQKPRPIMWIALMTNILNIGLSVFFVYGCRLGVVGVGLGTAVAQNIGAIVGLIVVWRILRSSVYGPKYAGTYSGIFNKREWSSLFNINRDIFLRTLCLAAVTLWFTHAGAAFGSEILAANALLMQLFLVFSYFMDGFAFGGEALAGRYYGARDFNRLKLTVRYLFRWGLVTSLLFTALYFFCGDIFLSLLSDDAQVIKVANDFRFWAVTVPLTGFAAFTWDGILIGLTRSRYLMMSMLTGMIVFFAIYFCGTYLMGKDASHIEATDASQAAMANHILWIAFIVYLVVRGAVATVLYRRFCLSHTR